MSASLIILCMQLQNFCIDEGQEKLRSFSVREVKDLDENVLQWYAICKERIGMMASTDDERPSSLLVVRSIMKRSEMIEIVRPRNLHHPELTAVPVL